MKIFLKLLFILLLLSRLNIGIYAYTISDYITSMNKSDYDLAIKIMDDIIKKTEYKNKKGDLYYKRACAYEKKGNFVYAAVDCSTALKFSPNNKEYLLLRGKCKKEVNDPTYVEDLQIAGSEGFALLNNSYNSKEQTKITFNAPTIRKASDVDINIPITSFKSNNTFALIFCVEDYMENGISKVDYARNDGEKFKEYCIKTLGVPERNIHFRPDATKNQIVSDIKWANNLSEVYGKEAQLILYYSGHGAPDERTRRAFLLPSDVIPNDLESGYALSKLYDELGTMNFNSIIVILDACFSGKKRNGEMLTASKGISIKPKEEEVSGNVIVLSATEGDDIAYPDDENQHGLFTYYILKKLQESKGNITIAELSTYVMENVRKASVVKNTRIQQPTINYSSNKITLENIKIGL